MGVSDLRQAGVLITKDMVSTVQDMLCDWADDYGLEIIADDELINRILEFSLSQYHLKTMRDNTPLSISV